jgi:hypothetical protein
MTLAGGPVCTAPVPPRQIEAEPRPLSRAEVEALWRIFAAIGAAWGNVRHDSRGQRSSWLEFVRLRAERRPSYVAEYVGAIEAVAELEAMHGADGADHALLFAHGVPKGALDTRLAHVRRFVVEEFIHVQLVAGGFRGFLPAPPDDPPQRLNFDGFLAGSRYNRVLPVRTWEGDGS